MGRKTDRDIGVGMSDDIFKDDEANKAAERKSSHYISELKQENKSMKHRLWRYYTRDKILGELR